MTAVDTQGNPPAAASAQPPEPPPAIPAVQDDTYIRVPRTGLKGKSWHEVMERYNATEGYDEAIHAARDLGLAPQDFLDYVRAVQEQLDSANGRTAAPMPPQPGATPPPPAAEEHLTRAEFLALMKNEVFPSLRKTVSEALQDRENTFAVEQQHRARREAAAQQSHESAVKALKEMGYDLQGADGKPNRFARMGYKEFFDVLRDVMRPSARDPDGNPLAGQALEEFFSLPTAEHLTKAGAELAWLKDYKVQAAADIARQQGQIPVTLGTGPAGKPPRPDAANMTLQQQSDLVMRDVPVATEEPG